MKSLNVTALLTLFVLPAAFAENVVNFSEADMDADGVLSIAEAKVALPDIQITDSNGDGLVNKNEVSESVEGYSATDGGEDSAAPVNEAEYRLIVQALAESSPRNVTSNN